MTQPEMIRNISPDDVIAEIQVIDAEISKLKKKRGEFQEDLNSFLGEQVSDSLKDNDYGCGTANLETDSYKVKAVITKKVSWDQEKLRQAYEILKTTEENPDEYIRTKFDVSENAYKNWPEKIRKFFEPCRDVKPSPAKYTFEKKESE